jgi:hypothetical protein
VRKLQLEILLCYRFGKAVPSVILDSKSFKILMALNNFHLTCHTMCVFLHHKCASKLLSSPYVSQDCVSGNRNNQLF